MSDVDSIENYTDLINGFHPPEPIWENTALILWNPPQISVSEKEPLNKSRQSGSCSGGKAGTENRKSPEDFNLPRAKDKITKKRGRHSFNGGPSEASQQPQSQPKRSRKEESDEEPLKKSNNLWAPPKRINDKIYRLRTSDKMRDMLNIITMIFPEMKGEDWPVRSDLQRIMTMMQEMKKVAKDMLMDGKPEDEVKHEMKNRLEEVDKAIQQLDAEREQGTTENEIIDEMKNRFEELMKVVQQIRTKRKDSEEEEKLQENFITDEERVRTSLCHSIRETVKPGLTSADQGEGSWRTPDHSEQDYYTVKDVSELTSADQGEGSWRTPDHSEQDYFTVKDMSELEKNLFADNKTSASISNFPGLEDALVELSEAAEIPEHLKDIASKIKKAWCITDTQSARHHYILILVYAAVHEMINCKGFEQLSWDRLSTWRATCNKAIEKFGSQVKIFEEHLKKILYGYLGFNFTLVQKSKVAPTVMTECVSAQKSFQGNGLSHGLFRQ